MNNTGGARRVFVRVFGFSDVERHALNTVFRLSESRPLSYALWTEAAPARAEVALMDGDNWEASLALANPDNDNLKLIWVGARPSPKAWRVFARPLRWSAVVEGMDGLYAPAEPPMLTERAGQDGAVDLDLDALADAAPPLLDLDFDLVAPDQADLATDPAPLDVPTPAGRADRALIIDPSRDARLYLRARLAMAGWLQVDEAETAVEVRELLRVNIYRLAILDLDIAQSAGGSASGWQLVKELRTSTPPIAQVIVTREQLTLLDTVRAGFAGTRGALPKPLHPKKLRRLLEALPPPG